MTRAIIGTVTALGVGMLLAFLLLNVASGCALVNDWGHPYCITPLDLIRGQ